ncbi:MAG TPA: hypothetical protein VNS19_16195 [Acidimicrobiales bacterium]|nr:hypothetical protein [Acidimicrobiales bacterium]
MSLAVSHPIPPELVGFTIVAAVVAAVAVVVAGVAAIQRRGRKPHPAVWVREPLEPWGSMVLAGLVLLPVAVWVARSLHVTAVVPLLYAGAAGYVVTRYDQFGGLRWLSVDDEGVHWRTLRRGGTVPLSEVVDVDGYKQPGRVPRVWLADGTHLTLDRQPQARLVAAGIDQLSMSFRPAL